MALINGGAGADTLSGSVSDTLTGGAGSDVFTYQRTATDVAVTDFGSVYFSASISGGNETPPNASLGVGTFSGALNRAHTDFAFTVQVSNLDLAAQTQSTTDNVTAAHFHLGPPGSAGGIVWGFLGAPNNDTVGLTTADPTTGTITGEWLAGEGNNTTLAAQVPNLLAGQIYINFHTTVIPAGEIRGQVNPVDTGADRIDVSSLHIGDLDTLFQAARSLGTSTLITSMLNGQASNMMLENVPLSSLTANDFIFADAAPTVVNGTNGVDDLFGSTGADTISGLGGADRLFGGVGADQLDGGAGNDSISGGAGADSILGGADNDVIQGNGGADTLSGGDGADVVFGGKGDDTVMGDAGSDTVSGDLGSDVLFGGAGADRFVMRAGFGQDWVADFNFAEGDRLMLTAGTTFTVSNYQNQALITLSSGDTIGLVGVTPTAFTNEYVVFG